MATEPALQLNPGAATSGTDVEVHFSNFPGVWRNDRPIAISALGFATPDEAVEAAKNAGIPVELVNVDHGSAPMPARYNHVADEEQARAIELAAGGGGFKTHADADAAAAAAGIEWPVSKMTLNEKTEFLATYAQGATDETGATDDDREQPGGDA